MVEILFEALNGENHPVGIPLFPGLVCRSWLASDGFFGERYDHLCEAGGLDLHTQSVPLHFLVDLVLRWNY
jgi:hypothetical protein